MDYIYKDQDGNKRVGEISSIELIPYYEFTVTINKQDYWCHLDHMLSEWCINIVSLGIAVELSDPLDLFWNCEALMSKTNDFELSNQIAYAIKYVYIKNRRDV